MVTVPLITGTGVISAPLRHMKPDAQLALPLSVIHVGVKPVVEAMSNKAQMPPQTWAPDKAVVGALDTLNNVRVGAAEMLALTVWEG